MTHHSVMEDIPFFKRYVNSSLLKGTSLSNLSLSFSQWAHSIFSQGWMKDRMTKCSRSLYLTQISSNQRNTPLPSFSLPFSPSTYTLKNILFYTQKTTPTISTLSDAHSQDCRMWQLTPLSRRSTKSYEIPTKILWYRDDTREQDLSMQNLRSGSPAIH